MTPRRKRCNLGCRSAKNFSLNRAACQYQSLRGIEEGDLHICVLPGKGGIACLNAYY